MHERFQIKDFVNAKTFETRYKIIDLSDPTNPEVNHWYADKAKAETARALLLTNQLNLGEGWNRSLLRLQGALSTDLDGMEIFVGLNRAESEKYAETVSDSEPDNDLIDMQHRHREARTGYKVDPA
ncbi:MULTISPECIES: hypothetical protein [unclassified Pseudomonas]|uniref:hypothetical protein n=1 Tax=unclassified Pseudomonas TaxID=196821 RepID=UPI000A1E336A|nr:MULTISPECIES: hypothetical protein [unclassified Pseudomonas]